MAFVVPGYSVDRLLGVGSSAEVWSGRALATGEPVALKRIALPGDAPPDLVAELVRVARAEAALLAALDHPSLTRFHRYLQTSDAAVLVMELADGGSLAQLLHRRGRLTPVEVAAALSPVAAALAYAHGEDVLHGDVSAANILFAATGHAKLADLGVARLLCRPAGDDRASGTPAYLDPVLAAGGTPGPASDVFSLAAVALHCLTGAGPWQAGGPADLATVLGRAAAGVIEGLDGRLANCPPAMAAVLVRALQAEPHRRGSAAEFALDLGASVPRGPVVLAAGRIPPGVGRHSVERQAPAFSDAVPADLTQVARLQVRPEPAPTPQPRRTRHHTLAIGAVVAGVLLVGAVAATGARAAFGTRGAQESSTVARPSASSTRATAVPPAASRSPAAPVTSMQGRQPTQVPRTPPVAGQFTVDPAATLRELADRRAEAFARNRPSLLGGVYESAQLLAEDAALLGSRVPPGCGLTGLRTDYTDLAVVSTTGARVEVRVTASQPPTTLRCGANIRGRTLPIGPTRLAITLVRMGKEYRIAAQHATA